MTRAEIADSQLAQALKAAGYKLTAPRLAVLQAVVEGGEHIGPAEVWERARVIYPQTGRATVYRTLDVLAELGALHPIRQPGQRYMVSEAGHHHHVVCSDCGAAVEFEDCRLAELAAEIASQTAFAIEGHFLEFYGRCPQCAETDSDLS